MSLEYAFHSLDIIIGPLASSHNRRDIGTNSHNLLGRLRHVDDGVGVGFDLSDDGADVSHVGGEVVGQLVQMGVVVDQRVHWQNN